jgi:hypothetical protein
MEVAQTAVAVAQTAIPALPTGLPSVADQLRPLLAGATVDLRTAPADASSDAVTDVNIACTDSSGTLGQLDPRARDAAASAALAMVSRYYPKATITLDAKDASGASLLHVSRAPGEAQ